jgi:WhiB family transcriptional regulator, redox-sensing transcriptional regulator
MYWPGTTAAATGAAGFEAKQATPVPAPSADPLGTVVSPQAVPAQAVRDLPAQAVTVQAATAPVGSARVVAVPVSACGTGSVSLPAGRNARHLPCTDDPDLFFAESPADVESAKALCGGCPVRVTCFAGAVERREPWGVWGGELFMRGTVVPRKRPRGRPRKTEVAA